jgi:hypothetical protein
MLSVLILQDLYVALPVLAALSLDENAQSFSFLGKELRISQMPVASDEGVPCCEEPDEGVPCCEEPGPAESCVPFFDEFYDTYSDAYDDPSTL